MQKQAKFPSDVKQLLEEMQRGAALGGMQELHGQTYAHVMSDTSCLSD